MAKKKSKKIINKKPVKETTECFLFSRQDIGVEALKEALAEEKVSVQCWPAMEILELEFGEAGSVDIEKEPELWEEGDDAAFLQAYGIQSIFALTMPEELTAAAKPVFEKLCAACEAVICPDTEDFMPVIAGNLE